MNMGKCQKCYESKVYLEQCNGLRGESLAYKLLRLHKKISVDVLKSEQEVGFLGAYTRRIVMSALVVFAM
jgi:hypothetical protein